MRTLTVGDVTITSIIERDGPWRKPEEQRVKVRITPRHVTTSGFED